MKKPNMRRDTYDDMHRLLKDIKLAEPNISEAEAKEKSWEVLSRSKQAQSYFRLLHDNWFIANWPRYKAEVQDSTVTVLREARQSQRKRGEKREVIAKRTLTKSASVVLMNLPMPNGKTLGDCTGAECLRFGGWFADIGKAIGPAEKVGKQLSEQDLRNLLGRNQRAA